MTKNVATKVCESVLDILPDYAAVNLMYFRSFRRLPNLRHPRTYNEETAWRKLYQHSPQFPVFCDKIAVEAEIARGLQQAINLWRVAVG
jgi:hypothetical protein